MKNLPTEKKLSLQIGKLKEGSAKNIIDKNREATLMHYYEQLCEEYQLDTQFIKQLFTLIIINSRDLQQ